jgi:hypothetical protein
VIARETTRSALEELPELLALNGAIE